MSYIGYFSISFEIKIPFYTEILTRKVELWFFSLVKKDHKTTFLIKRGWSLRAVLCLKVLWEIFSILLDIFEKFFRYMKHIGYWQFLTKNFFRSRHLAALASLKWPVKWPFLDEISKFRPFQDRQGSQLAWP